MNKLLLLTVMLLVLSISFVAAEELLEDDITVFGLELEKLSYLGVGLLGLGLAIVTFLAFKRTHNFRLLYVCVAFMLFALKGFLISHELFLPEWGGWLDLVVTLLDVLTIMAFFIGVVKK